MSVFHMLQQVSSFALLTLFVGLVPLGVAILYAWRPAERWLALMRPLSLAAIFAALGSLMSGVMVILRGIAATSGFTIDVWSRIAMGVNEAIAPMFIIFACQTLAWLLVAAGMRRVEIV
jgi:hypothetical protein